MSASVNNSTGEIQLTRGDTLRLNITLTNNGEAYEPTSGDTIRFAMKKSISDTECLFLKDIPVSTMTMELTASETKTLPKGKYVYDIELTTADGDVYTFIGPAVFLITDEVY